jgi:hypothetical protein
MADTYEGMAICFECIDDNYLKNEVLNNGHHLHCSVCNEENNNAITVEQLGKLLEPIIREHFNLGQDEKKFGKNDNEWWEQSGEPLSSVVQQVLGQYFDIEDEIIDAVIDAEDFRPRDGDQGFFDKTSCYEERSVSLHGYYSEWNYLLDELKHKRRFFNEFALDFFKKLFESVEALECLNEATNEYEKIAVELPQGTQLFRARDCKSRQYLREIYGDPFKHVGPPPDSLAIAGRMNANGVPVFYGAMDMETCIAEMRPVLAGDTVVISLNTTKPLRLLDFTRLENSIGDSLSYFQSDFTSQVERHKFLRRLHRLISQPITPSRESDYLITQTMTEYLAHVHTDPFDGILFASAQRDQGVNVVLFPESEDFPEPPTAKFPLVYIEGSIKLYQTESIEYTHIEKHVEIADEDIYVYGERDNYDDDD